MNARVALLVAVAAACTADGGDGPPIGEGPDGGGVDAGPGPDAEPPIDAPPVDPPFQFARCDEARAPLPPLIEDRRVYQQDTLEVIDAEVLVEDLDAFAMVDAGVPGAEVRVRFVSGDFGAGGTEPNATLKIRGGFSRLNAQKNYKIHLDPDIGRWRNQKEINLNKHMTDMTRMRNKIAFDLFRTIPHLTSARTQYVHLKVNGQSAGVYTWIEELDRRFLDSHGFDPDGQLYKAVGYHFDSLTPEEQADPELFRLVVEGKANDDDHTKFLQMTAAVNDRNLSDTEVLDRYFNRDNLATWLAANILLGNVDNRTQNYYVYSPSSCDGFYILPWDYDGSMDFYAQHDGTDTTRERWERGLTNQWPMKVFQRFYREPGNLERIDQKVRELAAGHITEAALAERIAAYRPLVAPFIAAEPDVLYMPYGGRQPARATAVWEAELLRITDVPVRFLAEYDEALERPMPVFMSAGQTSGGTRFRWDFSWDPQLDPLAYDLQVATSSSFAPETIVAEQRIAGTSQQVTIPGLASGTYTWRVVIRDMEHADAWQLPYNHAEQYTVP